MSNTRKLPSVKRIEGHGRVTLTLDEAGLVNGASFDVTEFRGFERFLEGRMVWEMPLMTSRVCGICPVSHHVAAVQAVDALYGVEPPKTAMMLRELLHMAGLAQDHALHFFFLAGPDFLLDGTPASRDLLGVAQAHPELARAAIGLRRSGQRIATVVGGRPGQPVTCIPGGMSQGLDEDQRAELMALADGMLAPAVDAAALARESVLRLLQEHPGYASAPVASMAVLGRDGAFTVLGDTITILPADGGERITFPIAQYEEHLAEAVLPGSYANAPYLRDLGPQAGKYRVGPLARLNLVSRMTGPISDEMLLDYRATLGAPVHSVLAYHWARMIELVAAVERMRSLLEDPEIASADVRVPVQAGTAGRGVAAVEAPRGTLIHDYSADPLGKVQRANLIVATTHNVNSLDAAVLEAVVGQDASTALAPDIVKRMELGIRAHDPCLSCATHELGKMPLTVEVIDARGRLVGSRAGS